MMRKLATPLRTEFLETAAVAWEGEGFLAGLFVFQGFYRLSIWREGFSPEPMSWEELQKVKSACGFGNIDAVEVYPRDCDVVNTGNGRHLYLMPELLAYAMRSKPPVLQGCNLSEIGEGNGNS